jgi:hypothetical protein
MRTVDLCIYVGYCGRSETWPHGPMRPTPPSSGALVPLTVRQFGTNYGTRVGADFRHQKRLEARFIHPQVRNGEPETEA